VNYGTLFQKNAPAAQVNEQLDFTGVIRWRVLSSFGWLNPSAHMADSLWRVFKIGKRSQPECARPRAQQLPSAQTAWNYGKLAVGGHGCGRGRPHSVF